MTAETTAVCGMENVYRMAIAGRVYADGAVALLHDISLALAEVINNITRHGYRNRAGREVLQVTVAGRTVIMTISDDGPEFDPLTAPRRDLGALAEHITRTF